MMKKLLIILISIFLTQAIGYAQSYPMGNGSSSACSGNFYDSGGSLGNYSNNENYTYTICSSTPGQQIFVQFNNFSIESGWDYLYIYDGPNTTSPLLGSYTGTNSPGTVSSSTSGCLTFVFTSDGSVTYPGWDATISCGSPPPPPPASVQDCDGAIPVCQNVYYESNAYSGTGNIPNEINSGPSCLGSGEKNDVWYTFTVQQSGQLCFSITPNNIYDDYDWAVYNLTNANCSDIYSNAALEVSCNYSGATGITGPNGQFGSQNNPCITVNAGETYVVNVSQYSTSTAGYTLDFSASTAVIFDNVPPQIQSVNQPIACGSTTLDFNFSENILCSTVQDADFSLTGPGGPYTLSGVTGLSCSGGVGQENNFSATVSPPLTTSGTYQLCLTNASGSVTDLCGNVAPPGCLTFTITNGVIANAGPNVSVCSGGTVTLGGAPTGSGGASPYSYAWTPSGGLSSSTAANPIASPTSTTTYYVTVTDANGCSAVDSALVTVNTPLPPTMSSTDETCAGSNDGTATATPNGMVTPISYTWNTSPIQNTQTATGLAPGTYTVTLTDANGCTATGTVTVNAGPLITAGFTNSANQCLTGNNYSFTNTGTTGVSYSWDFGDGNTSTLENPTHSYTAAGTYTVTQTVTNGTCTDTYTSTITVYNEPVVTVTGTDVTCNGANDGTATAVVSSGTSPYNYLWNTSPVQTTSTASGLAGGTYTIVVTDANGCQGSATVTINEPTPLSISETHIDPTCAGGNDGTATASPSGATPPYSYQWDAITGNQTTQTATGLTAGTYTVTVTDANGCSATLPVTLTDPAGMILSNSATQANCGLSDGSATVTVSSGGVAPFSYQWDAAAGNQTTQTANNLAGGTYIVTVTDANGCMMNDTVTVPTTSAIGATASLINNVSCFGGNDGAATVTPSGGTAPYTYSWSSGGTGQTENNLVAGTYTVTVTDANGCTGSDNITITEPTALVSSITSSNDPACFGGNNGDATVSASGGTPPYTYSWSSGGTASTETGLSAGTYTVTVTDANGCTATSTVTLNDGAIVTSSIVGTDVSCNGGNNGSANLTPSGGTAPYTYSWSNGSVAEDPNGLTAGTYNVTITDANGCIASDTITINEPTPVIANIDSTVSPLCNGGATGTAYASASGGVSPYTYSWSSGGTNATETGLSAGIYTVTVTDANGCTANATATITEPSPIVVSTTTANAYCNLATGTVSASASGGTPPYLYTYDSASVIISTSSTANNLYPGTYQLTVEDANGCKQYQTIIINSDPGLTATISNTVDVSCNGGNDGTATVSVSGGYPSFSYLWNDVNAQTTQTAGNLSFGTYTVIVTDSLGCQDTASTTVSQPAPLSINFNVTNKTCPELCNGDATALPSGGVSPYTYQWNDPMGQVTQTASNLCDGYFTVTLTDANGCTTSDSVSILSPPAMVLSTSTQAANCNQADGSASVTIIANGTAPFTYDWTDGTNTLSSSQNLTNVQAGTYFINVTDSNGCVQTDTATIANLSGPTLNIDSVHDVSCNGLTDGFATVSVSGGTFPYAYQWNDPSNQTTPTASNLAAGSYTVTITDSVGCSVSTAITINEPLPLNLSTFGSDPTCFGYNDGMAYVVATGGTLPYNYQWNTTPVTNNDTALNLTANTYTVTVTDSNGCMNASTVTLNQPLLFTANITTSNVSCFGNCNGTATANTTNGITPFTYIWDDSNNQTTQTASGLCADTFNVQITDANGCIATASTIITEPDSLVLSVDTFGNVSCNGGNDGFAMLNVIGGTGPYTFLWSPGNYTSQSVNNLTAGTYTITVSDANGCSDVTSVVISEPPVLSATYSSTDVLCNGTPTGLASVTVIGGTQPYAYQWNDVALQQTDTAFNLTAGSYDVTITDSLGCTYTINNITINEPAPISATTSTTSSTCGFANGSASVSVSGGVSPYNYQWSTTPPQITSTATNIPAGNYYVLITDANGCVDSAFANVTDLGSPTVTITSTTDVSCNGANDGSATASASGGTSPYTYSWSTTPVQTGTTATNLAGGTYSITVTDANGCIASASVTINENSSLVTQIVSFSNVSCNGGNDGSAIAIANGGDGNYSFSWNSVPAQTNDTANNLIAGTYIVTVTDGNGCNAYDTINITEPNALLLSLDSIKNVNCNGGSDGYIGLSVSGGTPGYQYIWTPNISSGATASGLNAGIYNVVVNDFNGCSVSASYTINEPLALVVDTSTTPDVCMQGTGSATAIVSGGTPPYVYSWNDPNNQTSITASSLISSSYIVTVTDANGCVETATAYVPNQGGPVIDSVVTTPVLCYGQSNGTATVYVSGSGPFTYSWNDAFNQATQTATGLSASPPLYTVTVSDGNGCTSQATANVTQPSQLYAVLNAPDTICYGESAQLFANGIGGTPPYNYNWGTLGFSGQGPHIVTPTSVTTYTVTIQDGSAGGCTADTTITIIVRPPLNVTSPDVSICNGDSIALTANATGGTGSYTYNWFEYDGTNLYGAGAGNPLVVSPANSTQYVVYVSDGCSNDDSTLINVTINDSAFAQLVPSDSASCPPLTVNFVIAHDGSATEFHWDFDNDGIIDLVTNTPNATHVYNNVGTYDVAVYVYTAAGCESQLIYPNLLQVYPKPLADFTFTPPQITLMNPTVYFNNQSVGANNNQWFFGDATGDTILSPQHTYQDTGNYLVTLIVENQYGCIDSIQKTLRVVPDYLLLVPNTFTPDGDGLNDLFFPVGIGINEDNFTFLIFNRWGELIFEAYNQITPWDGKPKGSNKVAQTGTYVWVIETTDLNGQPHKYIGHVNLLK